MNIEIITPEKQLYRGKAISVTVPSLQGPFTMLEHHAPIAAILEAGKIVLTDEENQQHEFAIKGGFCEQHDNYIIICAEVENGKRRTENEKG